MICSLPVAMPPNRNNGMDKTVTENLNRNRRGHRNFVQSLLEDCPGPANLFSKDPNPSKAEHGPQG